MRKKLALLLAVVLGISVLSGCTPTELAYLELGQKMNRMTSGELAGEATLEIDANAMLQAFSDTEGGEGAAQLLLGENAKRKMSVKWDGTYVMNDGYRIALHVQCGMEGKSWDLGTVYLDVITGRALVSKDGVMAYLDLLQAFDFDRSPCYAYTKEYKEALAQELKDCKFIEWDLYGDESTGELLSKTFASLFGAKDDSEGSRIMTAARTFLRDAHEGYESGLLQKTGQTYQIRVTLAQLPEVLSNYLKHIEAHPEQYRTALNTYLKVCIEESQAMIAGILAENGAASEDLTSADMSEAMNISKEDFASAVASFGAIRDSVNKLASDEQFKRFEDSYYEAELLERSRGVYESKVKMGLLCEKTELATLSLEVRNREKAAAVKLPETQVTGEQLEQILEQLADQYNPVRSLTLEWEDFSPAYDGFGAGGRQMWAERETEQREPLWNASGTGGLVSYENRSGRLHVRLRDVCSMLRITPQWNANVEKAYVQVGNRFVYLDGYQKEQSTWIAVRELEKLGYDVSYEYLDGTNVVTVTRK